uniref:Uncharacterized protein n=1 Tax=Panagrolaimus sp. ES5 TaxID=591445 RepID=A0AC34G7F5_9BILA
MEPQQTTADVPMADAATKTPIFTQNGQNRVRISSHENDRNINAILREYVADLKKALNEAYSNVDIYRDQFIKAQKENSFLKKQIQQLSQNNDRAPHPSTSQPITNTESIHDRTIIVTNVTETDETGDSASMKKMDSSIEPQVVKRLGEKADGKKRIIAIEFSSKKKK